MHNPRNSQANALLIIVSLLAVVGGLAIVLVTSPQSLQLFQNSFLPARATDAPSPSASPIASDTPPASATATASATRVLTTAAPTAVSPTPRPTTSPTPSPTPTFSIVQLTDVALPADARGLAVVKPLADSQTARVRDLPSGSKLVAAVAGGTRLQVLFGDVMADDVEWVEVRLDTLQTGWIARSLITFTYERPGLTSTPGASPTQGG